MFKVIRSNTEIPIARFR